MGRSPDRQGAPADHRKGSRRRGEVLHRAIFTAVLAELVEVGYAQLTMERVAERASASKASLYRRWPNRAELVIDAVCQHCPALGDLPETGDLRADLLTLLRCAADALAGPVGHAVRGLITEGFRDPAPARAQIVDPGTSFVLELLHRAAARGDVRTEAVTPRIAGVGPALLRHHFLVHGAPIDDEILAEIVDQVVLPLVRPTR